ncbi:DUF742 domain-containing protein [Streptomyces sp. Ru73]|uniref:DUF742 domain-containing protein n=1 Tax=Streptomyces sp. Ru73 TaxID=2080748 RepID=UPI0021563F2F|nr:DUF742 domain-containing protein [Streptomyces sp. Ru73]
MPTDNDPWVEVDAEEVRPYAVTGGRTRPRHTLRLASRLAPARESPTGALGPEAEQAHALCCAEPRSVAEIAALLRQPATVTKIILSDLLDQGALRMAVPDSAITDPRNADVLEACLAGLRRKFSAAEAS